MDKLFSWKFSHKSTNEESENASCEHDDMKFQAESFS